MLLHRYPYGQELRVRDPHLWLSLICRSRRRLQLSNLRRRRQLSSRRRRRLWLSMQFVLQMTSCVEAAIGDRV